jgi:hypothetical protein
VNKLIIQGHEQQKLINFLMEKSQMVDQTEKPAVSSEPLTDPITVTTALDPVVHSPRERLQFEASLAAPVEPELPLPPEPVRLTDVPVVRTNKRYTITQKVLCVIVMFVMLITGYLGPMETLNKTATGFMFTAQYVMKVTSAKKQVPKVPALTGRSLADDEIAADGHPSHRRRNPARQQWADDERDEV